MGSVSYMLDLRSSCISWVLSWSRAVWIEASRSPIFEPRPRYTVFKMDLSEQLGLARASEPARHFEVFVSAIGCNPAARRAMQEAELNQIGFVDFFDGFRFFTHSGSYRVDADRAAAELFEHSAHDLLINFG